jgi:hypothetical protein
MGFSIDESPGGTFRVGPAHHSVGQATQRAKREEWEVQGARIADPEGEAQLEAEDNSNRLAKGMEDWLKRQVSG